MAPQQQALQQAAAFATTLGVCVCYILLLKLLAARGVLGTALSRKLLHIGCGLLYMLCWPLYLEAWSSRIICASVPLLATVHFCMVGCGVVKDDALISSSTRTGDRRELLTGPALYGLTHVLATLVFWRGSPAGAAGLAVLCAGDGLAEVIGKRFGGTYRLHNGKSAMGSMACALGGSLAAYLITQYFKSCGFYTNDISATELLQYTAFSALGGCGAEAACTIADNFAVFSVAAISARVLSGF